MSIYFQLLTFLSIYAVAICCGLTENGSVILDPTVVEEQVALISQQPALYCISLGNKNKKLNESVLVMFYAMEFLFSKLV